MLHVRGSPLGFHGRTVLRHSWRRVESRARVGSRHLSKTSEPPPKPGATAAPVADEEPGWPLKYKLAGGAFLGTIIPWMFSYAVANDPGSRRLVGKLSPALVQHLRRRKGGHFFDEDPKRLEYLAHASDWIDQPVTLEVHTDDGETRRLIGLDARMPFSSVSGLLVNNGGGSGGGSGGVGTPGRWLTDFDVLDEGDSSDGKGEEEPASSSLQQSTWDTSSASSVSDPVQRDVAMCNIRSWWDIALIEEERARQPAPTTAASSSAGGRLGSSGASAAAVGAPRSLQNAKKLSAIEQADAMIEQLDKRMEALEQDKLTGARSVDDVEEEVRELRKQRRELRRKHPGRRRFLGLF